MTGLSRWAVVAGGVLAGAGVWLLAMTLLGKTPSFELKRSEPGTRRWIRATPRQAAVGVLVAVVIALVTRWWALSPAIIVGALAFSGRFGKRAEDSEHMAKAEALATWCERLRDAVDAGAGLVAALNTAARTAPDAIATPARRLADQASTVGISPALVEFSRTVRHGSADSMVMAMIVAEHRGGKELVSLLSGEIKAIRHELLIEKEENGIRQRYRTAVRILVGLMLGSVVVYRLISTTFLQPYRTATGQGVLLVLSFGVLASLRQIVRLSERADRERLFDPARIVEATR